MSAAFWIRRFVTTLLAAAVVLTVFRLMKGIGFADSLIYGLRWGSLFSGILTLWSIRGYRKGLQCAICQVPQRPDAEPHHD